MKVNKTAFIIVRVTEIEKKRLKKLAKKASIKFSNFIRRALGLG